MKAKSYSYKIFINKKCMSRLLTHNRRRFTRKIGTLSWREVMLGGGSVYLRVSYGRHLDNFEKMTDFYNDGDYLSRKDLMLAYRAFVEGGDDYV